MQTAEFLRTAFLSALASGAFAVGGCSGSVKQALDDIERFRPDAEKRRQEIKDLASPGGVDPDE